MTRRPRWWAIKTARQRTLLTYLTVGVLFSASAAVVASREFTRAVPYLWVQLIAPIVIGLTIGWLTGVIVFELYAHKHEVDRLPDDWCWWGGAKRTWRYLMGGKP